MPPIHSLALAYNRAQTYIQVYGLPAHFAMQLSLEQVPAQQEEGEKPNIWNICEITYFAYKYRKDITRIVHLLPQKEGAADYLHCYDLQQAENRTPVMNKIKAIRLLSFREVLPYIDSCEYIETLVLGKTAEQADRDYTARQEADNAEIQMQQDANQI
jgi:hypothetical protein